MVIKLKKKLNSYLRQVWLIEITLIIIIASYWGTEIYRYNTAAGSKVISSIESIINPQKYYSSDLKSRVIDIAQDVYYATGSLSDIYYGNESVVEATEKNVSDIFQNNIYFIIRNKQTGQIISNDKDALNEIDTYRYDESYIKSKYRGREVYVKYDNENSYNPAVDVGIVSAEVSVIKNYEEYYYTGVDNLIKIEDRKHNKTVLLNSIIVCGIWFFLVLKVISVLAMNKGKIKIRGNFIATIFYVLINGIKYKKTRYALIGTIALSALFLIGYLYLLATGGYDKNLLVNFFRAYPFKGSIVLVTLPLIGVVYSIKKSVDILKINESLKKINEGDLNYDIVKNGGSEVIDLIDNITKIKDGYEVAVEDKLKNEKLKTELISNVSHDLRTPLTSIINYVNILSEGNLTEEEREDYLKIVEQKSKRLKVLIDDLFEMSKINSGKIRLNKSIIDIMSLIYQGIGEYSCLYEDKHIEFKVDSFKEEIFMELDGKMMSRAIENIIINCLKYSLEGTRVYVDVKEVEEGIQIAFKNISNYEMNFDNEEIFERFARGDGSRNSKIEGSGLGLAITKSIIELHGGKVKINREGDMFKIYIILKKDGEQI